MATNQLAYRTRDDKREDSWEKIEYKSGTRTKSNTRVLDTLDTQSMQVP